MAPPESPAGRAPGDLDIDDVLRILFENTMTRGEHELDRADTRTGMIRLNLSISVRHGRPQGSTSSLHFEEKTGY